MGKKFILSSTSGPDDLFPFVEETRHFAMLESLDHDMIDRLIKTFKISLDSPVFEKRIETSAKDISYCFLEKVVGRKNDFSSTIQDDSILQKMLHANSLFNDYKHPPTL